MLQIWQFCADLLVCCTSLNLLQIGRFVADQSFCCICSSCYFDSFLAVRKSPSLGTNNGGSMSQKIRRMSKKCCRYCNIVAEPVTLLQILLHKNRVALSATLLHTYATNLGGELVIQMDEGQARVRQTISSFHFWSRALDQSDDDSSFGYRFLQCHLIPFPSHQFVDWILRREGTKDPLLEFANINCRFAGIVRHCKGNLDDIDS